jgi:hypothetical protein
MIERTIAKDVTKALEQMPAVALLGPHNWEKDPQANLVKN